MSVVIAIDPGSDKCGLAVVSDQGVLYRRVLPPTEIPERLPELIAEYSPDTVVMGNGTHGRRLADALRDHTASLPIVLVDESYTTLRARTRFFEENPPRGLLRLIPRSLLTPGAPIDDLAAVILAEEYLAGKQ